ncbi:MAG: sulfurtransferase [Burkholderiales bacterium]
MSFSTLVSSAQLTRHLDDPDWIVFDCRHSLTQAGWGKRAYDEMHIPGAFFLDLDADLSATPNGNNGKHPLPDPEDFAIKLSAVGLDAGKQAVAYDDAGATFAARLWWMLRWLGHERVAVLDGGWRKWLREDLPVKATPSAPKPARFVARADPSRYVDVGFIERNLNATQYCLIDARSPQRFLGIGETLHPVAGHIPGARNRYFQDNLDAASCFKPAAQLRVAFDEVRKGIAPENIVHQCGSGVSACQNLLAMEIAGLSGSKLYPGSWSEWCADPKRPIVAPQA